MKCYRSLFYAKDNLQQIQRSQKITISYNSQETPFFCHTQIQSVYLQAWLACQLDWQFLNLRKENNTLLFSYQTATGPVEIILSTFQLANLPPGLILSMEVSTVDGEHFSFKREPEILHQITYVHSTQSQCSLPSHYIFTKAESGHSLVKEICHRGTSEHFLKVLNLMKKMDGLSLC